MKTRHLLTLLLALFAAIITSCGTREKQYVIGVSQCSEDSWRSKLHDELDMATYFNEGVTMRYASANDDVGLQERQINEMIDAGVDLLIVSPQQMGDLTATIDRAFDKGIPVILFDRKTDSEKYTAFMGANNYDIGHMIANYVAEQLHGEGCIVEIGGLKDSSPAIDRTRGFRDGLKKYPNLKVVAYDCGDWKEESGQRVMDSILVTYDGPIDCIFGGNDRMAVGARRALERHGRRVPLIVGIDALPGDGLGICQVRDGILTASAIYPTHGDELMALALNILEGRPYQRETPMASSLVTGANAKVLLLQNEEVVRQGNYLRKMHTRIDNTLHLLGTQRAVIGSLILLFLACGLGVVFIVRAYKQKQRLAQELQGKNALLGKQRDEMEKQADLLREQRDTLQEQHDQLCEQRDQLEAQRDELALQRDEMQKLASLAPTPPEVLEKVFDKPDPEDNLFYQQFMKLIDHNVGNSEFSVEHLADALGLSRAQMYRRCKQLTGNSPVEILRIQRMQKAGQMLSTTGQNISEVTYACGFTSPSYFTKCFKEHYGMSPSDFIRHQKSNKHNPI